MYTLEDISNRIAKLLPELGYTPPEPTLDPNAVKSGDAKIAAELEGIWFKSDLRNDRIREAAGVSFRDFDETLRDCVESLVGVAGVETGTFKAKI